MNNFTAKQDCKTYVAVDSGRTIPIGAATTDISVTLTTDTTKTFPAEATNSLDAISQIGVLIAVTGTMPAGTQLVAVVSYNDVITKTLTQTLGRAITNDTAIITIDGEFLEEGDKLNSVTVKYEQDAGSTYDVTTQFFKKQAYYDFDQRESMKDGLPGYVDDVSTVLAGSDYTDLEGFSLYVGGAGDVKVDGLTGGTETIPVAGNSYHPIKVTKVYQTGTTATDIFAWKR